MPRPRITSTANPLVKQLVRLWKRRERERTGTFLVEGAREVRRAFEAGIPFEHVLLAAELAGEEPRSVAALVGERDGITEVSAAVAAHLSRRQNPDGILAVASAPPTGVPEIALSTAPLLMIVESIEKPGNLGAMLRTAEAAGVDAVLVAGTGTDVFNPNVIRASQGSVFAVTTVACTAEDVLSFVRANGIDLFTFVPGGGHLLWDTDLTGPAALAIGAEDAGLSPVLAHGGRAVRIPMQGGADSLNASVAAAIGLYEAVRQRTG